MILGTVIALLVVVAIMAPRHKPGDLCPHCQRDFDEEADTNPENN